MKNSTHCRVEMKTHTASCKPELILLRRCMLQGFVGGILAAMAVMLFYFTRGRKPESFIVVFWLAIALVIGGFWGALNAIPFWALNCFRRSPLPVLARIIMGGFVSTPLWWILLIGDGGATYETIAISSGFISLLSLPTSLLIGSQLQAGKFFSFRIGGLPPTGKKRLRIDIPAVRTAIACECDPDHQCLGSRFAEWQQRVA